MSSVGSSTSSSSSSSSSSSQRSSSTSESQQSSNSSSTSSSSSSSSSSTQRSSSKSEAKNAANSSSTNAKIAARNDVSSFTPASKNLPPVALNPPEKAARAEAAPTAKDKNQALSKEQPQPEQVRITASNGLNLRSVPSTEGNEPLGVIPNGTRLQVTPDANGETRKDGFVHVSWDDNGTARAGWVSQEYTSPVRATPPTTPGGTEGITLPALNLELGDTGTGVRNLQAGLVNQGYLTEEQVTAAGGTFDAATQEALTRFQQDHNVQPASGYFGPLTREAFRTALDLPRPLGTISRAYESNGNPATVSSGVGDPGGVSYGAYQFATNRDTPTNFVNWLEDTHPTYHEALSGLTPGTEEFSTAWRDLAAQDPEGFFQAQHDFVEHSYYDVTRDNINDNLDLDLSTRSQALNDVLWSTAVQHGTGGAESIFRTALGGQDPSTVTDADLIEAIYEERGRTDANGTLVHFSSSSADVQQGVADRFVSEQQDALDALAAEGE